MQTWGCLIEPTCEENQYVSWKATAVQLSGGPYSCLYVISRRLLQVVHLDIFNLVKHPVRTLKDNFILICTCLSCSFVK